MFSTLVDDKQRISFGVKMNQSLAQHKETSIKVNVKIVSSGKNGGDIQRNETNNGQLVLSILDKGRKMLLYLLLPPDKETEEKKQILLTNWSSLAHENGKRVSVMDNDWHYIDITFHQHKSFALTVNNRSQKHKVNDNLAIIL